MNIAFPSYPTLISKIVSNRSEHLYLEDFIYSQEEGKQIANLLQTENEAIASISLGDSEITVNLQKDPKFHYMI